MQTYELRDPIHSRIVFDEMERQVIDHPFMQRLRFISQMSFFHAYTYPGGVHDRFQHCLGAMHVAGRLFGRVMSSSNLLKETLQSKEIDGLRRRVRFAGLMHDIGHGPFSHSSEALFPDLKEVPIRTDWWKEGVPDRQAEHEDYSVLMIQTLAQEGVLDEEMAQDICSLIHGEIRPSSWLTDIEKRIPSLQKVLKRLISGEVDCDRMDYLLRDSYYCGVAYGRYDIDWLISSMRVTEKDGELIFAFSENGIRAVEDILLARYHMFDQVYYHKTKVGFSHYLNQAIAQGEIELVIPTDPYNYADLRDGEIIERLFAAAKDPKNYWSYHLMNRLPARRVMRFHEANPEDHHQLKLMEDLCHKEEVKCFKASVKAALTQMSVDSEDPLLYVAKKTLCGYEYVPMAEYSALIKNYAQVFHATDLFVHREDRHRIPEICTNIG